MGIKGCGAICPDIDLGFGIGDFYSPSDIYDSEKPYGPYQCETCGAEYEELKDGQEPISGPVEDWQNQAVLFSVALAPYRLDGTDIQVWENSNYDITLGRTSPQLISIRISKKTGTSKYLPELVVTREISSIMPDSIKIIPAACELNIENLSTYMREMSYAEKTAKDVFQFFISPIREGTYDWGSTSSEE